MVVAGESEEVTGTDTHEACVSESINKESITSKIEELVESDCGSTEYTICNEETVVEVKEEIIAEIVDRKSEAERVEKLEVPTNEVKNETPDPDGSPKQVNSSPMKTVPKDESFHPEKVSQGRSKTNEVVHQGKVEPDQISNTSVFENRELIQRFHSKMYRLSKLFVYAHIFLCTCGAIGYSVVAISSTNEWHEGIETPGWHIQGGFTANVVMINTLAVAVNLNLCFAALLTIGFHQHNRMLIWMWYLGQLSMEVVVTSTLVLSVFYDCKLTAMLSIPPFLYYVVSLSSFHQILATISLNKFVDV